MQPENRKKNFYCGDKVDYDEQCTSQCDRCVDAKGVDYGYLPEEDDHYMDSYGVTKSEFDTFLHMKRKEKSLINMTCTCLRPSPGDFTSNCRNCGFRIKDNFDHSLDALKSAVKSKYPESAEDEVLDKIKFVLSAGNSGQAIRLLEQYGAYKQEGMYSKEDLKKAFEAGHDSARLKGSYKSNGTYQEDLSEFLNQFGSK